jgi:hypothetical protein
MSRYALVYAAVILTGMAAPSRAEIDPESMISTVWTEGRTENIILAQAGQVTREGKSGGGGATVGRGNAGGAAAPGTSAAPAQPRSSASPSPGSGARTIDRGTRGADRPTVERRAVTAPRGEARTEPREQRRLVRPDVDRGDRGARTEVRRTRDRDGDDRNRRRGTRYSWGPGAIFYFYDGFYHGDCDWLRRKAQQTGSSYWRARYRQCRDY